MKPTDIFIANYFALPGLKFDVKFFGTKSVTKIINTVSQFLDVDISLMKKKTRKREIVEARQIAMFFMRKHTRKTLKYIGTIFGGRDHTTAYHAWKTVNDLCFSNEQYKQRLLQIENLL